MRKKRVFFHITATMNACLLASCAGGGTSGSTVNGSGGGITLTSDAGSPNSINQFATAVAIGNGLTGTYEDNNGNPLPLNIAAPSAATVGTNSTLPPLHGPLSTGMAFPLKQSVISVGPTGTGPDAAPNQSGATLTLDNWNPSGSSQIRLSVPGLGLNYTISSSTLFRSQDALSTGTINIITSNMNYAFYGLWEADTTVSNPPFVDAIKHVGAFVTGYETLPSAMPTSGTATYSGTSNVTGVVTSYPNYGGISVGGLKGDASFSVNFGTGSLSGNFMNMTVGTMPWNNVSVAGSITNGTSYFSGTTATTSVPPGGMNGTATGLINGSFYGPSAQELGAVWSLSDGSKTAIGVVGAHQ